MRDIASLVCASLVALVGATPRVAAFGGPELQTDTTSHGVTLSLADPTRQTLLPRCALHSQMSRGIHSRSHFLVRRSSHPTRRCSTQTDWSNTLLPSREPFHS